MGLICYVLYLPVKKLAYYLNTGSPSPPFLPSMPGNSASPPSFTFPPQGPTLSTLLPLQPDSLENNNKDF